MKKNFVLGTVVAVFLIVLVLASSVAPALAETIIISHQNAQGKAVIDIAGHPKMRLSVLHVDWDRSIGARDVIQIWVWHALANRWLPVAYFTDNSQAVGYYQKFTVIYPTIIEKVDKCDIQVGRIGKTVFAYWTIPLVVPEEKWGPTGVIITPEFTIPAGGLVFKGYGDVQTVSGEKQSDPIYPYWTQTIDSTGYNAHATLVCPKWHYWGQIGESTGPDATSIRTDALVTTTFSS